MLRDGRRQTVDAAALVPGDVLLLAEGDRISADARLLEGAVEVDLSTLTGESQPVCRSAGRDRRGRAAARGARPRLQRHDVRRRRGARRSSSRPACRPSSAASRRSPSGSRREPSPLERQVRRVAWLIAARRAASPALAFLPIGWLVAGLPLEGRAQLRDRPDRRERPRGAAADDHARARRRRRQARAPRRAREAAERGRDARLDGGDLHRQDGDADREPDARDRGSGRRPASSTSRATATRPRPAAPTRRSRLLGRAHAACTTAELGPSANEVARRGDGDRPARGRAGARRRRRASPAASATAARSSASIPRSG